MENSPKPVFEDPALKAALARSCSKDGCPLHLRQRIGQLFGKTEASENDSAESMRMSSIGWRWKPIHSGLALAAVLLIVVGVVGIVLSRSSQALPSSLQTAVITRHDLCTQNPTHTEPGIPQNFALLGPYLRQQLNHAVLAANLTKENWHFRGAAICPVGDVMSAHLVFDQAGRTLSILSLPASSYPALQNHKTYEGTSANHAVIARREDGAIFCLVSNDPNNQITVADLTDILHAHENEVSVSLSHGPHIWLAWVGHEGALRP
jgi:hypothetical protein